MVEILVKEIHLLVMILSGIVFAAALISTSSNKFILSHDHCSTFPEVDILDSLEVEKELNETLSKTKDKVIVLLRNSLPTAGLLNLLKNKDFSVDIYCRGTFESGTFDGINHLTVYNYTSDLNFNAIIADQTVYIAPNYFSAEISKVQRIRSTCTPLYKDILGYVELFQSEIGKSKDNYQYETLYKQSMIGHSTAVRPTIVGDSSFFMFHSPQSYPRPLRIAANYVLQASISQMPKEVYLYTDEYPLPNPDIGSSSTAPSIYILLKSLQVTQQVKFNILVHELQGSSDATVLNALPCYENVSVRLYPSTYAGLNFLIMDDEVFLFSTCLKQIDLDQESVHMELKNKEVRTKLLDYFNTVWEQSTQKNCTFTV